MTTAAKQLLESHDAELILLFLLLGITNMTCDELLKFFQNCCKPSMALISSSNSPDKDKSYSTAWEAAGGKSQGDLLGKTKIDGRTSH